MALGRHTLHEGMKAAQANGCKFVNVSPLRTDIEPTNSPLTGLPVRPNTDTALMLGLAHCAGDQQDLHDKEFLASHCTGWDRFLPYLMGEADGQPKGPRTGLQTSPASTRTASRALARRDGRQSAP